MTIAVDAMGGDRAPRVVVEGAVEAARRGGARLILVGDTARVEPELKRSPNGWAPESIALHHASEVIEMGDAPTTAVKAKKDSSLVVAARLVKDGKAEAFLSMGNTGACMATGLLVLGRLEGVQRPAIAVPIPHATGTVTVIDAGANVDCRPSHLVQFGVMGGVYAELIHGIARPRVGLLNVGEEEGKGNEVVQEAHGLLKSAGLNYVGNIEGRDVVNGRVDVVVCDGFTGNIVLKFAEGMADAIRQMIRDAYRRSGLLGALGAWLSRPAFRLLKDRLDPAWYGGAPLLGVDGVCIVGHGSSSPVAITNAIGVARRFVDLKANDLIRGRLAAAGFAK